MVCHGPVSNQVHHNLAAIDLSLLIKYEGPKTLKYYNDRKTDDSVIISNGLNQVSAFIMSVGYGKKICPLGQ